MKVVTLYFVSEVVSVDKVKPLLGTTITKSYGGHPPVESSH